MHIRFYLKYSSRYGQEFSIRIFDGQGSVLQLLEMHYLNEHFWVVETELKMLGIDSFQYSYVLSENGKIICDDVWEERKLEIGRLLSTSLVIYDDWHFGMVPDAVFASKAFREVLLPDHLRKKNSKKIRATHYFKVHAPELLPGKELCLTGSSKFLGNWTMGHFIPLKKSKIGLWEGSMDLSTQNEAIEFKVGVWDVGTKKLVGFESGLNRVLEMNSPADTQFILHLFANVHSFGWKASGVNVQLSSLRSKKSWGVGDFSDLNLLSDWCVTTGLKMIQLLPIHDTTATYTHADSYPYSAVSTFALHPIFLNVSTLGKRVQHHKWPVSLVRKAKSLNESETLQYEEVLKLKLDAVRMIFTKEWRSWIHEEEYIEFINENKEWLHPYAAFSVWRDLYKTPDYTRWELASKLDDVLLDKMISPDSKYFTSMHFYFFLQHQLHVQLCAAVLYAHERGVILKGDLPIGVGRYSADSWQSPELFHLDMQAGAPPDQFAVKGQNWSFPTYNWEVMSRDGFTWWRKRLQHMDKYFDAVRVDHVLGFFRIWSIPVDAVEGILGYFVPAVPFSEQELRNAGIDFNYLKYCKPRINEDGLRSVFGNRTEEVRDFFLQGGEFKKDFDNQRKVEQYFSKFPMDEEIKTKLFDLHSNVILLEDRVRPGYFHFRIHMQATQVFQTLSEREKGILNKLYHQYFFKRQNELWLHASNAKLDALQHGSDMMICAEDLGMVPEIVEGVLKARQMLSLQVQRMPKLSHQDFSDPAIASYLSVVTPSTHDMSPIRQWWEEDAVTTQRFFNHLLHEPGKAPGSAPGWICQKIIQQHLESPAMWAVFLIQDLLSMDESLRKEDAHTERNNIPADPKHFWNYRMHLTLEDLKNQDEFNRRLKKMLMESGRFNHRPGKSN